MDRYTAILIFTDLLVVLSIVVFALTLEHQGKNEQAEQELRSLVLGYRRFAGENNPVTFYACIGLAIRLSKNNKASEALSFSRQAEGGLRRILVPSDQNTRVAVNLRESIERSLDATEQMDY